MELNKKNSIFEKLAFLGLLCLISCFNYSCTARRVNTVEILEPTAEKISRSEFNNVDNEIQLVVNQYPDDYYANLFYGSFLSVTGKHDSASYYFQKGFDLFQPIIRRGESGGIGGTYTAMLVVNNIYAMYEDAIIEWMEHELEKGDYKKVLWIYDQVYNKYPFIENVGAVRVILYAAIAHNYEGEKEKARLFINQIIRQIKIIKKNKSIDYWEHLFFIHLYELTNIQRYLEKSKRATDILLREYSDTLTYSYNMARIAANEQDSIKYLKYIEKVSTGVKNPMVKRRIKRLKNVYEGKDYFNDKIERKNFIHQ